MRSVGGQLRKAVQSILDTVTTPELRRPAQVKLGCKDIDIITIYTDRTTTNLKTISGIHLDPVGSGIARNTSVTTNMTTRTEIGSSPCACNGNGDLSCETATLYAD
jgi:hypothetical protein